MADITMCCDRECPSRTHCLRYRARRSPFRQSYGLFIHDEGEEKCERYLSTNGWTGAYLTPMNKIEPDSGESK